MFCTVRIQGIARSKSGGDKLEQITVRIRERGMVPRFVFAVLSVAFAIAVIFAVVTTVKHTSGTRAGTPTARVG
jgi:hypothetical protein